MTRFLSTLLFACLLPVLGFAQLVINEVSQGSGGAQEFVELLVIGTPSCDSSCADIRGWIIDDNSGYFAPSPSTGIATGHMRFSYDTQWSCVKMGTLIVIYNEGDVNPALPPDDITDANADCIYILPGNSTLLERDNLQPNSGNSSYTGATYVVSPSWSSTAMRNTGDSYQVVAPYDLTVPYHAVSWGDNTVNNIIYFSGNAGGKTFYMTNTADDNPFNQANWAQGSAGTNDSPGAPNSPANAAWIAGMNNNCSPILPPLVDAGPDQSICAGDTATLTASGTGTYSWSTGQSTASIGVIPLQTTTYYLTVTYFNCTDVDSVTVLVNPSPIADAGPDQTLCIEDTAILTGSGGPAYLWSTGASSASISVVPSSSSTYYLSVTTGGCTDIDSVHITVLNQSFAEAGPNQTICAGDTAILTASGGTSYLWSTGATSASIDVAPILNTTYSVTASYNGCSATDSVLVSVNPVPIAIISAPDTICPGQLATLVVQSGSNFSYLWSTGQTAQSITVSPLANTTYTVTVTASNGCTNSNSVLIEVVNAIDLNFQATDVSCPAGNDGQLSGTVTGAQNPVVYQLVYNGDTISTSATGQFSNLEAGSYELVLTDAGGCFAILTGMELNEPPSPYEISTESSTCAGETDGSITITGGNSGTTYSLNGQVQNSPLFEGLTAGNYTIIADDNMGCTENLTATVDEGSGIVADVQPDTATILKGGSVQLETLSNTSNPTFEWQNASSLSCADCSDPVAAPQETTTYIVVVGDENLNAACFATDTVHINVFDQNIVEVPNAFSPNGDGTNDFALIIGRNITQASFKIFNRWGQMVFEGKSPVDKWDGNFLGMPQEMDTYVYLVEVTFADNSNRQLSGNITLIR